MSDIIKQVPRSRRSRSSTPLIPIGQPTPLETPTRIGNYGAQRRLDKDLSEGPSEIHASFGSGDKISPMLAKLRMTPGRLLKEKQLLLVRKHEETRQKMDSLNVGGGVSLWPEMECMRLTDREVVHLSLVCVLLSALVTGLFYSLHGTTLSLLLEYHGKIKGFRKEHVIQTSQHQQKFHQSVLAWHSHYRHLVDQVHHLFDVSKVPVSYVVYVGVYTSCMLILLYYLVDNMVAKSKLSPRRIKKWVSLLSVFGTWTVLMAIMLSCVYQTEVAIERNVLLLSEGLADAVENGLNCDTLHSVLLYWKTRCLPPTALGTITILGVVSVRDLIFYLQYYTIPIATVLVAPVFKLFISLMTVYNFKPA